MVNVQIQLGPDSYIVIETKYSSLEEAATSLIENKQKFVLDLFDGLKLGDHDQLEKIEVTGLF